MYMSNLIIILNILTLLIACFIALMVWIIGDRQAKIHKDKFK